MDLLKIANRMATFPINGEAYDLIELLSDEGLDTTEVDIQTLKRFEFEPIQAWSNGVLVVYVHDGELLDAEIGLRL